MKASKDSRWFATSSVVRFLLIGVLGTGLVFGAGLFGMRRLAGQKVAPSRKHVPTRAQVVDVLVAKKTAHTVTVSGYATVSPARSLALVAEMSGRAVRVHPALRAGGFIEAGATLIEIDSSNLDIKRKRLAHEVARAKARKRALLAQRPGAQRALICLERG